MYPIPCILDTLYTLYHVYPIACIAPPCIFTLRVTGHRSHLALRLHWRIEREVHRHPGVRRRWITFAAAEVHVARCRRTVTATVALYGTHMAEAASLSVPSLPGCHGLRREGGDQLSLAPSGCAVEPHLLLRGWRKAGGRLEDQTYHDSDVENDVFIDAPQVILPLKDWRNAVGERDTVDRANEGWFQPSLSENRVYTCPRPKGVSFRPNAMLQHPAQKGPGRFQTRVDAVVRDVHCADLSIHSAADQMVLVLRSTDTYRHLIKLRQQFSERHLRERNASSKRAQYDAL